MSLLQVLGLQLPGASESAQGPHTGAEALHAQLESLGTRVKHALATDPARKDSLLGPLAIAQKQLKAEQLESAAQTLRDLAARIDAVTGRAPDESAAEGDPSPALAGWQAARGAAVERLRRLAGVIQATGEPGADKLVIMLQAIVRNLTPRPANRQDVLELERYLQGDAIIDDAESPNPFGIDLDVRGSLLRALGPLKAALPA